MSTAVASATEPTSGLGLALVKQELECGVCLDLYERPVTLACGHSLCEGCAKHMVGMEKSGSAFIRCPHCRAKTRWKSGKANLKVNITLQNMVDRVKRAQKVQADEEVLRTKQEEEEKQSKKHLKPPQADKAAKRKAKESHSSTETTAVSDMCGDDWVSQPRSPPAALPDSTTAPLVADFAAATSPPPAGALSSSPRGSTKGKEKSYGDPTAGAPSGSAQPFVVDDLEELPADSFPNPDAVAAFDAAIAALLSPEAEKQPASFSSSSLGTSPHQRAGLFSAQEVGLVPTRSGPSPDHQPQISVTEPESLLQQQQQQQQQQQDRLLDEFHEGFFPLPLAEESSERKRERKERRERSSRPNGTSEWDDSRERLSRSCRSPVPSSPPTRGRSEQLSLSQDTDRRSRSRSRGRQEREVTIVYDGIPEEYFELLMGQHGPIHRVEQTTNCKIKSTDQHGPMRGIAISGHPDDVRQARKQLVALIRESALQQDRWASGSGESKTSPSSALVKKKMNISRRQYELLLSNDMQLLHSIEATTETSIIFPTNSTSSRASSVPITIVGKREGVLITVDFLKANEEAAAKMTGSSIVGPPSRSQSATVPVASSASRAATTRSLGSSRSATHGKRRRRRVPATEGRVPGCVIS